MTQYLDIRPTALPALPALDASGVDPSMQARAARWMELTEHQLHLDESTYATQRPGVDPDWLLTDREYARLIAQAPLASAPATSSPGKGNQRPVPFKVYDGRGVMNTRFLRCGLFGGAAADERLPVLKSKTGDWVQCRGARLHQDHLDVMLALFRRTTGTYDVRLGEEIIFNPYELCQALGMAVNSTSLVKLASWIKDLQSAVIELHEPQGPHPERPVSTPLLSNLDNEVAKDEVDGRPLPRGRVMWSVVVPAPVYKSFVASRLFSAIRLDVRLALESPFIRWLSAYMSTHEPGYILALDMPTLAQAGGLRIATDTEHGRRNLRRQVRAAFATLASGTVETARGRRRLTDEEAQDAQRQGQPLIEVEEGSAKGFYARALAVKTFEPMVRVIDPPGKYSPDTIFVSRLASSV